MQALEGVGRGARLKRAAAQKASACLFDLLCHQADLLRRLDRAGACNHLEASSADLHTVDIDDTVFRMELAVGLFVRLLDALDLFNDIQRSNLPDVHAGGVAHQAQQGGVHALGKVDLQAHRLKIFL